MCNCGSASPPEGAPGPNFSILWDADMIVNLGDGMRDVELEKLASVIEKSFKTQTGATLAAIVLTGSRAGSYGC